MRKHLLLSFFSILVACGSSDATPGTSSGLLPDGAPDPDAGGDPDGGNPPGITCGTAEAAAKKGFVGQQSITVGGSARSYALYVPDGYDGNKLWPLVFVFHGDGGTGAGIRSSFKLEAESANGAIFVYPDGEGKTWVIDNAAGIGKDVAFVDAIAASIQKTHCVNTKKIFAVGFSKGAYFTNMLGCLSKTALRGVVGHAGGGPFGLDGSGTKFDGQGNLVCPSPPVAALQVQGEADNTVPLDEGQKARDHWRRVNQCATTSKASSPSPCIAYDNCAPGRPEIWCQVPGLGHQIWPTNGTKVTWDFIQAN